MKLVSEVNTTLMSTNPSISRRLLLGSLAAAPLLAAGRAFGAPLGVNLYTVRDQMPTEAEKTLKEIYALGYREVEVVGVTGVQKYGKLLAQVGLKPVSIHMETPIVTGAWDVWKGAAANWTVSAKTTIEEAAAAAKGAGARYLGMAYLLPGERGSGDYYKSVAAKMNQAGEACKKAGLQFFYHHHAFEFAGTPGSRPIDVLMKELDPKLVPFEVDVFWLATAGEDPAATLEKWKGRAALIHLKDRLASAPRQFSESVPKEAFKEVGNGSLDFAKIIGAAQKAGVKHFFVEQDQTAGSTPAASLKQSITNLRKLTIG